MLSNGSRGTLMSYAGFTLQASAGRKQRVSRTEAEQEQRVAILHSHRQRLQRAAEQRLLYKMGKFESNFKYNWS